MWQKTKTASDLAFKRANFWHALNSMIGRHPVMFVALFILPVSILLVSMGLKIYYLFIDTVNYFRGTDGGMPSDLKGLAVYFSQAVDRYIRELDIAGLLGGFVGIFLGLFVAAIADLKNDEEKKRVEVVLDTLLKTIDTLKLIVERVDSRVVASQRHLHNAKDIADAISNLLSMTIQEGNDLIVVAPILPFGTLDSYQASEICRFSGIKPHEFEGMPQSDYHKLVSSFNHAYSQIDEKIKEVAQSKKDYGSVLVTVITLDDDDRSGILETHLTNLVDQFPAIGDYWPSSRSQLNLGELRPIHERLLVAQAPRMKADPKATLIREVLDRHRDAIQEIEELGANISKSRIPLNSQMLISMPSDLSSLSGKFMALTIETEIERHGKHHLVASLTEDPISVRRLQERAKQMAAEQVSGSFFSADRMHQ